MSRDILSYCAGMFDADGCFSMYTSLHKGSAGHRYYIPTATIDIREEIIVDIFLKLFGGSKQYKIKKVIGHSPTYYWKASGRALENFILKIQPYLILKAEQAELILKFRDIRKGKSTKKITEEEVNEMEKCRLAMNLLNKKGIGKIDKFEKASFYMTP